MKAVCYAAAVLVLLLSPARAEVPEVRIARQFSMGYLQLNMLEHERLIQKHTAKLGIPEVKVTGYKFNGPTPMNDALLSDSVDIVTGGPQGLFFIWSRTRESANPIRAISALQSNTYQIVSRDPAIRAVDDLEKCRKIAVASVKTSAPAILIQAAAAKAYGLKAYAKFDDLTIAMTPPDAMAALLSGIGEMACSYGVQPYLAQMLDKPGIHTVLDANDVWGGSSTFSLAYTSTKFHDRNPKLYQAVYDALAEATDMVNKDPRKASQYWLDDGESKLPVDFVQKIATAPTVRWTMAPERTLQIARFMNDVGTLKVMPASWKDYLFPEAHGEPGS
jgi:NitT/TauT family transport system substrate-binding protein